MKHFAAGLFAAVDGRLSGLARRHAHSLTAQHGLLSNVTPLLLRPRCTQREVGHEHLPDLAADRQAVGALAVQLAPTVAVAHAGPAGGVPPKGI